MRGGEHQADEAAEARSFGAACLRCLREVSEQSNDPALREYAWRELQCSLVMLCALLADPKLEPDMRADAEAALRGFLDS